MTSFSKSFLSLNKLYLNKYDITFTCDLLGTACEARERTHDTVPVCVVVVVTVCVCVCVCVCVHICAFMYKFVSGVLLREGRSLLGTIVAYYWESLVSPLSELAVLLVTRSL